MKRNANTIGAEKAAVAQNTTTERKSAGRSTPMKRNANTVTVAAIDTAWKFTAASITLNGHVFDADKYAIAEKGDVYVLAKVEGVAVRIHVGKASPVYHEALEAATAFKAQPQPTAKAVQAEKPAEPKPAEPAKPVETKPAKAAKQPKAAKPAKQAKPAAGSAAKPTANAVQPVVKAEAKPAPQPKAATSADTAWIGTAIEGKGWRIAFDEAAQRTRVIFAADPSAKQKAAIDAAGFYWSNTTKSWNKKLTRKAYRAALALSETLNAIA